MGQIWNHICQNENLDENHGVKYRECVVISHHNLSRVGVFSGIRRFSYHGFLSVRTCYTPNLFLEWGNPLQSSPTSNEFFFYCVPYINHFCKRSYHMSLKRLINHEIIINNQKLINHDHIKPKNGWITQLDLFWFSPILKDSKYVWSHDPIVMPLNNWSHDIAAVVSWIQSDCLEMKKFKCTFQQSEVQANTR